MRLWSLHPKYLDPKGLVAVWREALLAQAVLGGLTRGYLNHSQLIRFRQHPFPLPAISAYLLAVHHEATLRGYSFDQTKIGESAVPGNLQVTSGQIEFEWEHLLAKLKIRSPALYVQHQAVAKPEPHPLFTVYSGGVESWERV